MGLMPGVVVFVIIWWLVFFCVLPFGVEPAGESQPGDDPGAPARPRLLLKFSLTTAIATGLFAVAYFIIESGIWSFRDL